MFGRFRRIALVALAASTVVGGVALDTGEVSAKKKPGALYVLGTTNKQFSCENRLTVVMQLTKKGGDTQTLTTLLSRKGGWSIDTYPLDPGKYFVNAHIQGHPTQNPPPTWPEARVKVKMNKHSRVELEQIHLDPC